MATEQEIYDALDKKSDREREDILSRHPDIARGYEEYSLSRGADNYKYVNSNRETQATEPTQPGLKDVGKAAGQAVVTEGLKEGAKGLLQSAPSAAVSEVATSSPAGGSITVNGTVPGGPGYLAQAGAVAGGAYVGGKQLSGASKFVQGEELNTKEKLALALPTFGMSLFSDQIGDITGLSRKSGKDIINDRLRALEEQGVEVPQAFLDERESYGLSQEELIAREEAKGDTGNVEFARTRDEKDLRPEDTWGGLMWFETMGNDYLGSTAENQRREMNQRALDEGLIDEARGQLRFSDSERAQEIYNEVMEDTPAILPGETKDGEPYSLQKPAAQQDASNGEKRRPKNKPKLNDIPLPVPAAPEPPKPSIHTPKDYAQAYLDVYAANTGITSGRY